MRVNDEDEDEEDEDDDEEDEEARYARRARVPSWETVSMATPQPENAAICLCVCRKPEAVSVHSCAA